MTDTPTATDSGPAAAGGTSPPEPASGHAGVVAPGRREALMRGWLPLTLGLLAVVLGALWTVQGLGFVSGSVMTDQRIWAAVGPVVVLIGLAALRRGMRVRRRS